MSEISEICSVILNSMAIPDDHDFPNVYAVLHNGQEQWVDAFLHHEIHLDLSLKCINDSSLIRFPVC